MSSFICIRYPERSFYVYLNPVSAVCRATYAQRQNRVIRIESWKNLPSRGSPSPPIHGSKVTSVYDTELL